MTDWTKTTSGLRGRGSHRYTLETDGVRWRWTVSCRGQRVASALAETAKEALREALAWIDAREEEP